MPKRFSKISGMHLVTCDYVNAERFVGEPRTCGVEFRSCSDKSVIDKQLEHAGWKMQASTNGGQSHYFCPDHAYRLGLTGRRMPEKRTW